MDLNGSAAIITGGFEAGAAAAVAVVEKARGVVRVLYDCADAIRMALR